MEDKRRSWKRQRHRQRQRTPTLLNAHEQRAHCIVGVLAATNKYRAANVALNTTIKYEYEFDSVFPLLFN